MNGSGLSCTGLASVVWLATVSLLASTRLHAQSVREQVHAADLSLERDIGAETGPEEYTFGMIAGIALASGGSIYVLDAMAPNVRVYSPQGRHMLTFGRSGGGPGEFVRPLRIEVDSVVRVFDMPQNRITVFSLDGQLRQTIRLPSLGTMNVTSLFRLRNGKLLGATTPGLSWGSPAHQVSVTVFLKDSASVAIDTLLTYHSGATVWYVPNRPAPWGVADTDFGPGGAWALNDSLIALVDGYAATVRWFSVGPSGVVLRREAKLPFESRAVDGRDLRRAKDGFRAFRDQIGQPVRSFEFDAPGRWSVGTAALFGADGALWVRNGRSTDQLEVWTVFPPSPHEPRVLGLPGTFKLMAATRQRLYGVSTTPAGAQVVRVYAWR
jgi:hypothetical protein